MAAATDETDAAVQIIVSHPTKITTVKSAYSSLDVKMMSVGQIYQLQLTQT